MGYESRLYVVNKWKNIPSSNENYIYAEILAMLNMSKCGIHRQDFRTTDCAIYADDGNTLITEDCYGDTLGELTIPEAIKLIEKHQEMCPAHRRWKPCLDLLMSFDETDWDQLVVLHYGY